MWDGESVEWYERAKIIMKSKGWSQAKLAREIKESESNVSRYFAGTRNQDSITAICKIANALKVSLDHLVLGVTTDSPLPPQLTIDFPAKLRKYADSHPMSKEHYIPVRIIKGSAAAGSPVEVDETETDGWALIYASKDWMPNAPEHYSCVHVSGRSMWPILSDGDIVAIDHAQRDPRELDGKMVAFRVNGGVTIKWLKYDANRKVLVGIPENTEELDHIVTLKGPEIDYGIVGKVAWWWAKR